MLNETEYQQQRPMSKQKRIKRELAKVKDPEAKERLLMVQSWYHGVSFREIAKTHACSFNKIKYWKDRYETEGIGGMSTKPRSGHPRAIDDHRYQSIKREVTTKSRERGWETKQIRGFIQKKSGVLYSERHVTRIAHDWGLSLKVPRPIYAHTNERDRNTFLKKTRNA